MKLKLMIDSSSGISRDEANKRGILYVSIPLFLNNQKINDKDHSVEWLLENLRDTDILKTSTPNIGELTKVFDEGLESSDHIVFLPISSKLSSLYDNALALSRNEKYKGKITIIKSEYVTPFLFPVIKEIQALVAKGNLKKVVEFIHEDQKNQYGWISPMDINFLKNGGRITKNQYIIGSVLKINPIVQVCDGSLTSQPVLRSIGLNGSLKKMANEVVKKIKEYKSQYLNDYIVYIVSVNMNSEIENFLKILEYNKIKEVSSIVTTLSPGIAFHMGPKAIGVVIKKKWN